MIRDLLIRWFSWSLRIRSHGMMAQPQSRMIVMAGKG